MRTKTVERRQAIVDLASEIFQEFGYSRASMSMISARVGGSKSTIYSYFSSKEELFSAIMTETIVDRVVNCANILVDSAEDISTALLKFADGFLAHLTAHRSIAMFRAGISGSYESKLSKSIYHKNAKRAWSQVGKYFEKRQKDELLRDVDVDLMVAHFKGLIESGIFEPLLSGDEPWLDPKHAAGHAVEAFLRAYGTKALAKQMGW